MLSLPASVSNLALARLPIEAFPSVSYLENRSTDIFTYNIQQSSGEEHLSAVRKCEIPPVEEMYLGTLKSQWI